MRATLTLVAVIFLSLASQAVTLHDLTFRLSYEKHVFPGRLLRGEIDPIRLLVQAEYYYNGGLFNGTVLDTSLEFIEATFEKGKIVSYRRDWDGSNYYRYNVTSSDKYTWYAVDAQFENGEVIRRSEYYLDPAGVYRAEINQDYPGSGFSDVTRLKLGAMKGKKPAYTMPVHDGLNEHHYEDGYNIIHNYKDGVENGIFEQTDSAGRILDRAFYSPDSGYYGEYIHVEDDLETRGQYRNGYAVGVWTTRDIRNNAVVQKEWFNSKNGQTDSIKEWYNDGRLKSIAYYPQTNKQPLYRSYAENGQLISIEYGDDRDTLSAEFTEEGRLRFAEMKQNGLIAQRFWHYNSGKLSIERYFNPETFYRDSVWRYWDSTGILMSEKYYANGRYIKTTVNKYPASSGCGYFPMAAAITVANQAMRVPQPWDTSLYLPQTVIDSVHWKIKSTYCVSDNNWMKESAPEQMQRSAFDHLGNPKINYVITIPGLDSCRITAPEHCRTNNPALNAFLDSLKLQWISDDLTYIPGKKRKRATAVHTLHATTPLVLNISYINRRLNALQKGARIAFGEEKDITPPDILYIPAGFPTESGSLPFSIVGFSEKVQRVNGDAKKRERYYYVYIVYGDGEVEYKLFGSASIIYSEFGINIAPN